MEGEGGTQGGNVQGEAQHIPTGVAIINNK